MRLVTGCGGLAYSNAWLPLSPPTDAVFSTLLARNLVREEAAASFVDAGLRAARELREGPHDRPTPRRSPRDPGRTTELVLDVIPGEENLLNQLPLVLGLRAGVVNKLLHLANKKKGNLYTCKIIRYKRRPT